MTDRYIMHTYDRIPILFVKGNGYKLTDEKGETYIDFLAGIAVNNLGYGNKSMMEALKQAAIRPLHVSNLYLIGEQALLAKTYVEHSCLNKVFFGNSGAEANEAAMKLARKYSVDHYGDNRYKIVTLSGSFHGRTMATITATGQSKFHRYFNPFLKGFIYAPPNDYEKTVSVIDESVAAVMIELVQGEGGIIPLTQKYVSKLYEYCKKRDIILIIDEIQTGMGRTGKLFSYQHYDIEPDIITIAKASGGGLPIGAMLAKDKFAKSFTLGTHASTFGGSPFVCFAAKAYFDELLAGDYIKNAEIMGNYLIFALNELKKRFNSIIDVRGLGLLVGAELVGGLAKKFCKYALANHFLVGIAGTNVVRFEPPLMIDKEAVDLIIQCMSDFLERESDSRNEQLEYE